MFVIVLIIFFYVSAFPQEGLVKSFHSNGNVESEINYKDKIREGKAKYFYENGNIREERNYLNGRVDGLVKIYSESGKLKEVFVIENGRREGPTNLFDENGNYLTDIIYEAGKHAVQPVFGEYIVSSNNQADVKTTDEKANNIETKPNEAKSKEESDELLPPPNIEEEKLENDTTFFSTIEVMPEPAGGMEAIYKKLIYPSEARKNEIQGTVKVKAFIDEYGEVIEAEVVEGIGYGCDDVARNAIYYARFKPGLQKGKHVRTMIVIPIEFRPEMDQK
jgi:TonB family protein